MNFRRDIRPHFPKAFKEVAEYLMVKHCNSNYNMSMDKGELYTGLRREPIDPRELYDFFDNHHIFVEVSNMELTDEKRNEIIVWGYTVWNGGIATTEDHTINFGDFETRTKSEEAAFTKAFEILENRINNEI